MQDYYADQVNINDLLTVPKSKLKMFGDCAFSVCEPRLGNDLPNHVKHQHLLVILRRS